MPGIYNTIFLQYIFLYLMLMLIGGASVYFFYKVFRSQFNKLLNIKHQTAITILLIGVSVYIIFFSGFSIIRYNNFVPGMYDMGNMEQTAWNTAQGDFLRMTTFFPAESRLHYHVEPIFIFLAPFYSLWPDGRLLLIIQAVIVALGAVPIFLIAKRKLRNNFSSLSLALAYLLYPAVHQANAVDFHPLALGGTFLLFGFYLLIEKKWGWSLALFLLAIACREEFAVMIFIIGLYSLFRKWNWKFSCLLAATGLAWVLLAVLFIFPSFSPTGSVLQYELYGYLGETPGEIITSLVTQPGELFNIIAQWPRVNYLFYLLAPVLFVPVLSLGVLAIGLVSLATLILRPELSMLAGVMHNHISVVAPVFLAAIFGLLWLKSRRGAINKVAEWAPLAILITSFLVLITFQFTSLSYWQNLKSPFTKIQRQFLEENISNIPAEASVAATPVLGPRIANRRGLYTIDVYDRVSADYVIYASADLNYCPAWARGSYSCRDQSIAFQEVLDKLTADPGYQLIGQESGIYFFVRK